MRIFRTVLAGGEHTAAYFRVKSGVICPCSKVVAVDVSLDATERSLFYYFLFKIVAQTDILQANEGGILKELAAETHRVVVCFAGA